MRYLSLLTFVLGIFVGVTGVRAAEAPAYLDPPPVPPAEVLSATEFVSLLNSSRAANGLPPLSANSTLTAMASGWVGKMAQSGSISHNPGLYVPSGFTAVAENVGSGGTVEQIHTAFMSSSKHRTNILNPRYTHVGVGVTNLNGKVWVVEVFGAAAPAPKPTPTPAPKPAPKPTPTQSKVPCP